MERAETDMFEMLQENTDFECITNGLIQDSGCGYLGYINTGLAYRDIKPENIVYHSYRSGIDRFRFLFTTRRVCLLRNGTFHVFESMTRHWKCSLVDFSKRADVHAFGKTILFILWQASIQGVIPIDKRLYKMFYSDRIEQIELPGPWQHWFDVAMVCCSKEPPTKIPLLPLTVTNTATTPNPITAKTAVKVFHAYPTLA